MDDRWLSVDEISEYLGVSKDTVYAWISAKGMPAHRVGRLCARGGAASALAQQHRASVRHRRAVGDEVKPEILAHEVRQELPAPGRSPDAPQKATAAVHASRCSPRCRSQPISSGS